MSLKELYNRILLLPFIEKESNFESEYQDIVKTLQSKKLKKSSEYLANLYGKKKKWASCFTPPIFTAGIHTTSRIESVNAIIKMYVNSNSEVSDLFDFVIAFEEKASFRKEQEEDGEKKITKKFTHYLRNSSPNCPIIFLIFTMSRIF